MSKQQAVITSDTNNENINVDENFNEINETKKEDDSKFKRLRRFLTVKFLISLLLGQFLSFCITTTVVTSTELAVNYNFIAPTFQTFLTYVALFLIYTPLTIYKKGFKGWLGIYNVKDYRFLKYFVLSLIDVEGNYFVVKAYAYTSVLSIMLLDAWAIPVCMLLSILALKAGFHWSQYLGVVICIAGLAILLGGDIAVGQNFDGALNMGLGDAFCLISATLYGMSNVFEELFVRQRPLYEVVGQMGLWGMVISGIQLSILERQELENAVWSAGVVGMLIAYNLAMICLYTGAPLLFRLSSATFFNLSLLTSDFFSLIFSLFLFDAQMHTLYPISFVSTLVGLCMYHYNPESRPRKIQLPAFLAVEKDDDVIREINKRNNNGDDDNDSRVGEIDEKKVDIV